MVSVASSAPLAMEISGIATPIQKQIQLVLWNAQPRVHPERRRDKRYAYPYPIRLLQVDDQDAPTGEEAVVIGKHLSERGLDFYYRQPIPDRRVIAVFDYGASCPVAVLMELTWCRFGRHGLYENGGRLLQALQIKMT